MAGFEWQAHLRMVGDCWLWVGEGHPPARQVWHDLVAPGHVEKDKPKVKKDGLDNWRPGDTLKVRPARDPKDRSLPPEMVLTRRCGQKACVNPDHMAVRTRRSMQRIAHAQRWGERLPEWDGKGCAHSFCRSAGCPFCP